MTTQKLFKRRVRERMARTGESYAAARGHVAVQRDRVQLAKSAAGLQLVGSVDLGPALELVSDERLREATGRDWATWLAVLDRWGARDRKRGETVAFLVADLGVPGWHAQAIVSGFERTRGIRGKHQQADGYTIYASKTVGVPVEVLFEAFADEPTRRRWLGDGALSSRSAQPGKVARFDWDGGPTRVLVTFAAKGPARSIASVVHERLPDPGAAEAAKAAWKPRLAALKSLLESSAPD